MQSQELELRAYGYVPVAQHEADTVLSNIYSEARGNANEEGSEPPVPHIGQVILKTVAGCNFACKTDTPGFGYECYEYVTDEWKDMPPVMDDEVAWQTGIAIGTYAARNSLRSVEGIIHGGEPLFVPNDPSRPGQKAAQYYDRILPLIRQAVQEVSPETSLSYTMQTNGSLLHEANLDMLLRHNVKVGVSMDGPQAFHDQNRIIAHNGRRIGTHRLVERGLRELGKEKYASIYAGIIAVMDLRSDPLEVLAELQRFRPPQVEIHMPYATWEDQPPGIRDNPLRTLPVTEAMETYRKVPMTYSPKLVTQYVQQSSDPVIRAAAPDAEQLFIATQRIIRRPEAVPLGSAVPYADWFLRLYNANKEQEHPLPIRLFTSVEQMALGGRSLTEAIGPNTGGDIVVRTDGSIELPDSLKMTRSGLEKTGFNVFDDDLEQVAQVLREHHHLGKKTIPEKACASCDIQSICGGGHIATRFSEARGFDNPSVYCADLEYMIRTIKDAVVSPQQSVVKNILEGRRKAAAIESREIQERGYFYYSREWLLENF